MIHHLTPDELPHDVDEQASDGRDDEQASNKRDAVTTLRSVISYGWLAKGFVFVVIGILAARLASRSWNGGRQAESGTEPPNQTGALKAIAEEPFGNMIVAVLAVGLWIFMVWNLAQAFVPGSTDRDLLGLVKRIGWFGLGAFYGVLGAAAVGLTFGGSTGGGSGASSEGSGTSPESLTGRVMDHTGGRLVVGIVALVVVVVAAYHLRKGLAHDFLADLDTDGLSSRARQALGWFGAAGFVARGAVLGLVGWFLIRAAVTYDSDEAEGLDGVLRELADTAYGRALLWLVAVGLAVAGAYDMITFRRQRIR